MRAYLFLGILIMLGLCLNVSGLCWSNGWQCIDSGCGENGKYFKIFEFTSVLTSTSNYFFK